MGGFVLWLVQQKMLLFSLQAEKVFAVLAGRVSQHSSPCPRARFSPAVLPVPPSQG